MIFGKLAMLFLAVVSTTLAKEEGSIGERKLQWSRNFRVTITNLSYAQPMSPFFLMVHGRGVDPIFSLGEAPSAALANLAENGDASSLQALYEGTKNVKSVTIGSGPILPGQSMSYDITITPQHRWLSLASMAINTNDCFVGANGVKIRNTEFSGVGYDAGSEMNNENCNSIPGPFCASIDTANQADGNGEGFVHVHRGVHGISDLDESVTDWRNPMVRVQMKRIK